MTKHSSPTDISLRDFIAAVGSLQEVHGAVSAAAAAGGLGASLLLMVATLPQASQRADRTTLVDAATELAGLRHKLIETIETETAARLFAAHNMPQASTAERSERKSAIEHALRASANVPLQVMRLCARGLQLAATVAAQGIRAVSADLETGMALLQAGFEGARSTLEDKLTSLADAAYVTSAVEEIARLSDEAAGAARAAGSFVEVPPA
jgi:formiminotetrahydrofolate cyclodeaminase